MVKTVLPVLLFCLSTISLDVLASDSLTVHVIVEGFKSEDGICRLLLFDSKEGFPDSPEYSKLILSRIIRADTVEFFFKVKPGKYAISVLHDENSNEKMDRTWYGKPVEGFGVSNNPAIGFGPPDFEESAVHIDGNNYYLKIRLNYL
jgi:uncharacterized protein (DUF2141 family)